MKTMMRKTHMLATAAVAVALSVSPALAQRGGGEPPNVAPLPAQQQAARQIDNGAMQREASNLLRQADQAVSSGNWARANEFLERAQTTMLNSQALHGGMPAAGSMPAFNEANRALMNRNRAEAQRALQAAMAEVDRGGTRTGSGTGGGMPMQGGGMGSTPHGGATMRDGGMGGQSMNRADAVIILAQGGGGGGGGGGMPGTSGSGGLPGGTGMTSPGAGGAGSTPRTLPTTPMQPGQSAASPAAPGPVRGAPPPGSGGVGVGTTSSGTSVPSGPTGSGTTR